MCALINTIREAPKLLVVGSIHGKPVFIHHNMEKNLGMLFSVKIGQLFLFGFSFQDCP